MAVSASTIRNVALLSHSGAGKTTLAETMLFNTKVTTRLGRVEDGNTVSDENQTHPTPVSYTHLTLPTILLV